MSLSLGTLPKSYLTKVEHHLLGDSLVVISGYKPLIWVIIIVTLLRTPLITTQASNQNMSRSSV